MAIASKQHNSETTVRPYTCGLCGAVERVAVPLSYVGGDSWQVRWSDERAALAAVRDRCPAHSEAR